MTTVAIFQQNCIGTTSSNSKSYAFGTIPQKRKNENMYKISVCSLGAYDVTKADAVPLTVWAKGLGVPSITSVGDNLAQTVLKNDWCLGILGSYQTATLPFGQSAICNSAVEILVKELPRSAFSIYVTRFDELISAQTATIFVSFKIEEIEF